MIDTPDVEIINRNVTQLVELYLCICPEFFNS